MIHPALPRLTVRLRLTLWYTALLGGALLLFSVSVYVLMSHSLLVNLDASLRTRIDQVMPSIEIVHGRLRLPPNRVDTDSRHIDIDTPYVPSALIATSGRSISGRLPGPLAQRLQESRSSFPNGFYAASVGNLRYAITPIDGRHRPVGYLVVWQSLRTVDRARRSLLLLLLATGPGLLLLSGIGGLVLARRALRPVDDIRRAAESISVTDLHSRVPVGPGRDELTELAATFNAMIDRLEGAVDRERRFTGDASHELRSPLAVILAEASLALEEPQDSEDYRRALGVIHEQATGMHEMVSALLMLARVETMDGHRDLVPLGDVIDRAVRHCALGAQERDVCISGYVEPELYVEGNQTLLTRAVRNLIDNAIKASPGGGVVRFRAERQQTLVVLQVEDEGPGIEAGELTRIFEPFYQVQKARTPGDSHGLGLAICRRIVRAHGGEVTVASHHGKGSTFGIMLPAALQAPAAGRREVGHGVG